jgi:hypothetical protein
MADAEVGLKSEPACPSTPSVPLYGLQSSASVELAGVAVSHADLPVPAGQVNLSFLSLLSLSSFSSFLSLTRPFNA